MKKQFMREAIALAEKGVRAGDGGPFGAVIVCEGKVIGRGWNRVVADCDPTAHGEVIAIRDASRRLGAYHLSGCTLYTSSEPCPMCLSAAYWARIHKIVYAASAQDAAAIGFDDHFLYQELARAPSQRRIPCEQLMRPQALTVFALWHGQDGRQDY